MRTLIKNAEIFTLNSKDEIIRDGFVGVDGDKICYVGAQRPMEKAEKEIDAEGGVLLPGFVNAHTHLPMSLLRGAGEDLALQDWLSKKIFPLPEELIKDFESKGFKLKKREDYLLGVKIMKSSRYSHFIYHEIPAATAVIKYFLVL